MYTRIHAYTHTPTHTYTYTRKCTHAHMHTRTRTNTYTAPMSFEGNSWHRKAMTNNRLVIIGMFSSPVTGHLIIRLYHLI